MLRSRAAATLCCAAVDLQRTPRLVNLGGVPRNYTQQVRGRTLKERGRTPAGAVVEDYGHHRVMLPSNLCVRFGEAPARVGHGWRLGTREVGAGPTATARVAAPCVPVRQFDLFASFNFTALVPKPPGGKPVFRKILALSNGACFSTCALVARTSWAYSRRNPTAPVFKTLTFGEADSFGVRASEEKRRAARARSCSAVCGRGSPPPAPGRGCAPCPSHVHGLSCPCTCQAALARVRTQTLFLGRGAPSTEPTTSPPRGACVCVRDLHGGVAHRCPGFLVAHPAHCAQEQAPGPKPWSPGGTTTTTTTFEALRRGRSLGTSQNMPGSKTCMAWQTGVTRHKRARSSGRSRHALKFVSPGCFASPSGAVQGILRDWPGAPKRPTPMASAHEQMVMHCPAAPFPPLLLSPGTTCASRCSCWPPGRAPANIFPSLTSGPSCCLGRLASWTRSCRGERAAVAWCGGVSQRR